MRFPCAVLLAIASTGSAFSPSARWGIQSSLFSTLEAEPEVAVKVEETAAKIFESPVSDAPSSILSGAEINARLESQLEKLRQKDATSPQLTKEAIKVLFEDDHIIAVEKPSGVLCVPTKVGNHNLVQSVYDSFGSEFDRADKMAVHRLGMDTSGVVVFAKNIETVRGLNTAFRTRQVERTYEALVCGTIEHDSGFISLPLMRDYEFPPFMRVSTLAHQQALVDLDPEEVGKKLLAAPKDSITKYEVISREELDGQPVTRVKLTSISGRTHQLNVHMAAFGHPIVGDSTYGWKGDAAPNGGLTLDEQDALVPNPKRAMPAVQKALSSQKQACVHAKFIKFRHPITNEDITLSCDAPF